LSFLKSIDSQHRALTSPGSRRGVESAYPRVKMRE
jgi:hypothetical protein